MVVRAMEATAAAARSQAKDGEVWMGQRGAARTVQRLPPRPATRRPSGARTRTSAGRSRSPGSAARPPSFGRITSTSRRPIKTDRDGKPADAAAEKKPDAEPDAEPEAEPEGRGRRGGRGGAVVAVVTSVARPRPRFTSSP